MLGVIFHYGGWGLGRGEMAVVLGVVVIAGKGQIVERMLMNVSAKMVIVGDAQR